MTAIDPKQTFAKNRRVEVIVASDTKAAIAERISNYLSVLTVERNAEAAADYYVDNARLLGPGMDFDKHRLTETLRSLFEGGMTLQVSRRTVELFDHGDAAYEIAEAEDTVIRSDGSSATQRNYLFIRWERGDDDQWRFARILLSPQGANGR